MRKITIKILIIEVFVFILFALFPFILHNLTNLDWTDILDYLPYILIGFIQITVSIVIVWYYFSRNPELIILRAICYPEKEDKIEVVEKYVKRVKLAKEMYTLIDPEPVGHFFKKMWKVECYTMPSKLRILFDISNIGFTGITVHDYSYEEIINRQSKFGCRVALYPDSYFHLNNYQDKSKDITYAPHKQRAYLEANARLTNVFEFPWDESVLAYGKYTLLIKVHAGTYARPITSLKFNINIESNNDKVVISWTRK